MSTVAPLRDQAARTAALDPSRSFIVQAPAGSGKTALLIQRYLVLLARVQRPEEILALTFTRKAANEMRTRILEALALAQQPTPPTTPYELALYTLARQVPPQHATASLQIQTIDAFCARLVKHMPLTAKLGIPAKLVEDPILLYQQAAKNVLLSFNEDPPWAEALETLLLHLDNNFSTFESLCVTMLGQRDQWLSLFSSTHPLQEKRQQLEQALKNITCEILNTAQSHTPPGIIEEWIALANFAAHHAPLDSPLVHCRDLHTLPSTALTDKKIWEGLATLLLTKDYQWRKTLTASEGFPPPSKAKNAAEKATLASMKQRGLALLEHCAQHEAWRESLEAVLTAPPIAYTETQWSLLTCLLQILPVLVAALKLEFQQQGAVDYTEIAQSASEALGDAEHPTDLALIMDHRIQHILVDEFQDTSVSQFHLLMQLTCGWENNDGRTLFFVGDPMQSIYRFRKAEVGLFLKVRDEGLGHLHLDSLCLTTNFRAEQGMVDWLNATFTHVFPHEDDPSAGAITYTSAHALKPSTTSPHVHYTLADGASAAAHIARIVQDTRAQRPTDTIALLVRAKNHLLDILPALRAAKIPFRAIEIAPLSQRPAISDLTALTRALTHLGDRIAWLAILRAPWCGLTLNDLHTVANTGEVIWDSICTLETLPLSEEGKQRLRFLHRAIAHSLAHRHRLPLARWVEETWTALQGPQCLQDPQDHQDADAFFKLLQTLASGENTIDLKTFQHHLDQLYASPTAEASTAVEIMTIHKAKGLEFDTVILPSLEKTPAKEDPQLLLWTEYTPPYGAPQLLLAPIKAASETHDPIYQFLSRIEKRKRDFETARLIYVAATRAKKNLHLIGHMKEDAQIPAKGSLLSHLWRVIAPQMIAHTHTPNTSPSPTGYNVPLQRLPLSAFPPLPEMPTTHALSAHPPRSPTDSPLRMIGEVVHRFLYRISIDGLSQWSPEKVIAMTPLIQNRLLQHGVLQKHMEFSIQRVQQALLKTLNDPKGRWILSSHAEAQSEYPVCIALPEKTQSLVIDRAFIDAQGCRWIIDYKTSTTENDLETFLAEEENKYRSQLLQYAAVFKQLEQRPLRMGLYFPLLTAWREITDSGSPS